jgi:hypothetical protein
MITQTSKNSHLSQLAKRMYFYFTNNIDDILLEKFYNRKSELVWTYRFCKDDPRIEQILSQDDDYKYKRAFDLLPVILADRVHARTRERFANVQYEEDGEFGIPTHVELKGRINRTIQVSIVGEQFTGNLQLTNRYKHLQTSKSYQAIDM